MLFFIVALIATISLAVYVYKKTKTKSTSFLAQGEYLIPEPTLESVPEQTPDSEPYPKVDAPLPTMEAKPKKKPQSKKKPATKVDA